MPEIGLLFSDNGGLHQWGRTGSLSRETALYKLFSQNGWNINFFTYDKTTDLPDLDFPVNIYPQWPVILPKKFRKFYQNILPWRYKKAGRKLNVLITNQAHSAGPAVKAARKWKTKLIARCGYVYGESAETLSKSGKKVRKRIEKERYTFQNADICVVPTKELKDWLINNYEIPAEKIEVIPNYVQTDKFFPNPEEEKIYDIISVGRLVSKKRHDLLIDALAGTDLKILIIGDGREHKNLLEKTKKTGLNLEIKKRVDNDRLPELLNRSKIYVNVSKWEGHPKAMIEAMSCGLPCIGADSPGIKNLLQNGKTGVLVKPEHDNIKKAVKRILNENDLADNLGQNARKYVKQNFDLEKVFRKYEKVLLRIKI